MRSHRGAGWIAGAALLWAGTASAGAFDSIEESIDRLPFSISGDIGVVSKYVFRAQSALGNDGASVQGSFNIAPDALEQLSLGFWYSTIDGTEGGDEMDFIVDFTQPIGENASISVGALAYTFVGDFLDEDDGTAGDVYVGASAGPISTILYYTVSGDRTAAVLGDDDIWWEIGSDLPGIKGITPNVTLQFSRYDEGAVGDGEDFQLIAVPLTFSKDITDNVGMSLTYSFGLGDDRAGEEISDELWAGAFISF